MVREAPQIPEILGIRSPYSGAGEIFARSNLCLKCQYVLAELLEDCPFTGVWFVGDRKTDDYQALIYVKDQEALKRLSEKNTGLFLHSAREMTLFI